MAKNRDADMQWTLVNRNELLSRPEFWAVHMFLITKMRAGKGDRDPTEKAFGKPEKALMAFYKKELCSEKQWPYFPVTLLKGYSVWVQYSNYPEDNNIDYCLDHSSWSEPISLGVGTADFMLPALRWEELLLISRNATIENTSMDPFACALLLLLPAVWFTSSDPLSEACTILISAWQKLGVIEKRALAEFVDYTMAISGSNKFEWREEGALGWINNSQWSARNPKLKVLSKADLDRIHKFFQELAAVESTRF